MHEHLFRDIPSAELSESLNRLGRDGWSLVNCWPAKKGLVSCVFRREHLYYNEETESYEPSHPLDGFSAEAALKTCLAAPDFRRKGAARRNFKKSIPLSRLAAQYGVTEEAMATHLRDAAGFIPSTTTADCFAKVVGDYNLWIHRSGPKKPWILYAKEEKPTELANAAEPAGEDEFSVAQAIELCEQQPLKKPHKDHSLDLARAAAEQGTSIALALAAFKKIGLPAEDGRYGSCLGRSVLLRPWAKNPNRWFLCVRSASFPVGDKE